jgi:predicted  nucleic acid-binding Zn-ribbon protein
LASAKSEAAAALEAAKGAQGSASANAKAIADAAAKVAMLEQKTASLDAVVADLQNAKAELSAGLTELQSAVAALKADNKSNADAIAKANADIATKSAELSSKIAEVSSALGARIDAIDANLNKILANYVTKDELSGKANELAATDAQLQAQIATNLKYIETLQAAAKELGQEDAELQAQISAIAKDQAAATASIASLQKALENLQADFRAIDPKNYISIDDLNKAKAALEKEIAGVEEELADAVKAAEDNAKENADAIAALKSSVEKDVLSLNNDLVALEAALATQKTELQKEIAAAKEAASKALEAAVAELEGKITDNEDVIAALVGDVADLDKFVKDSFAAYDKKMAEITAQFEKLNVTVDDIYQVEQRLTGMSFIPSVMVNGIEAISLRSFSYVVNGKTYTASSNDVWAEYRLNPANVSLDDIDTLYYVASEVNVKSAVASPIEIKQQKIENGILRLNVGQTKQGVIKSGSVMTMVSLLAEIANDKDNQFVYSDYVGLDLEQLSASDYDIYSQKKTRFAYPNTFNDAKTFATTQKFKWDAKVDLNTLVSYALIADADNKEINLAEYGFSWKFSLPTEKFEVSQGGVVTDQQQFIKFVDANTIAFKNFDSEASAASVGKTPIVKVSLVDKDGLVITEAYIKFQITAVELPNGDLNGPVQNGTAYILGCDAPNKTIINVATVSQNIYTQVGMSATDFWTIYNNVLQPETGAIGTAVISTQGSVDPASSQIEWTLTVADILGKFNYAQLSAGTTASYVGYIVPKAADSGYPKIKIEFNRAVSVPTAKDFKWTEVKEFWKNNLSVAVLNPTTINSGMTPVEYNSNLKTHLFVDMDANAAGHQTVTWPAAWAKCNTDDEIYFALKANQNADVYAGIDIDGVTGAISLNGSDASKKLIGKSAKVQMYAEVTMAINGLSTYYLLKEFDLEFPAPLTLSNVKVDQKFKDGPSSKIDISKVGNITSYWNEEVMKNGVFNATLQAHYGVTALEFDMANLETSFADKKMPAGASVNLVGQTLEYINNGTKLQESYQIRIPVKATHKWSIDSNEASMLKAVLVITVEP